MTASPMRPPALPLLLKVLRDPGTSATLDLPDWDMLLRQADSAGMRATLLLLLEDAGLLDTVPTAPRVHLEWARARAVRHAQAVRYEVRLIGDALAGLDVPLLLLKGAAYTLAGLEAGRGRLFSDIDILVPRDRLPAVEAALMRHGWVTTHHDAYDQRYYRDWMHELPPMKHALRDNVIDVHHAILPLTAAARPSPDKLRAGAVPLDVGSHAVAVLSPHDMVLHSAVHLFSDGEFNHGLRDLFDIHRLLGQFGSRSGFWDGLVERAHELQLERPLFYALRYAVRLLHTPVPPAVVRDAAAFGPGSLLLRLMDVLFERALLPAHPSCADALTGPAHSALYIRGNWLRMPPLLLARHLFHKAFISPRKAAPP
jgi:hypothetical protein